MREPATLKLDSGIEVSVEVDSTDVDRDEFVVRRRGETRSSASGDLLAAVDAHLSTARTHPAGTTDRLLAPDRGREY